MQKMNFNGGWKYRHLGSDEAWKEVDLPHDAAIFEARSQDAEAGVNTGWFLGADYEYIKTFMPCKECEGKDLVLEFEGVYHNAEVYINGEKMCYRPYGYTNFYVDITDKLSSGENEIRVIARNSDQPNSRWYSGAGIYRPVNLYCLEKRRIELNGIRVDTLSTSPAVVAVEVKTSHSGEVEIEIEKDGKKVVKRAAVKDNTARLEIEIKDGKLWTSETPELYNLTATFEGDKQELKFGIRQIICTPHSGLLINGERLIIRGACIHHDNGILGARCYPEAEERKIRILKENGYNAIRSAHNPCSKALLEACDRLGMYVMDEYVDMWYIHKNRYDYADYIEEWYERDIKDMVEKDYNHPSVIMYSFGNEVAETGEDRGIAFFEKMQAVAKGLDGSRPTTVGVNIFFNYLYALGFGQYSDKKAKENPNKKVGSEFFNALAGMVGAGFMKTMACLPGCDRKTKGCFAVMDVAGYNYGIKRYKHDLKKYPERIILGSETFCADAYEFWEMAKNNPRLIGDFVWAGMDYLGEVGVGSWEYKEYAPSFLHGNGWLTAGSGRIDLIGNPLGEALYTKVAFELEQKPQIAVVPVNHTRDKHSPSAWKFSDALPSWSWEGCEGKKAKVEVYSRAPVVELYINGKRVGRKSLGKNCRFDFTVEYEAGEIVAVAKDKKGNELARGSLRTAASETVLAVTPEKSEVQEGEICFVPIAYTDGEGVLKPLYHKDIEIEVEGGELLAFGNACPYNEVGYNGDKTFTYYGRAMAVVKAASAGEIAVRVFDGEREGKASIKVG